MGSQSPCRKDVVSTNPVVPSFLARAFVPYLCNSIWSFSSQPLLSCQWPPNPATQKTRHWEPTFKHGEPHSQAIRRPKGLWRDGSIGQCLSHLPSCSLARKLLPDHPNTRHCLGVHMTLAEETGVAPPSPHTWMAVPLVKDMLCYGRTGSHWSHE